MPNVSRLTLTFTGTSFEPQENQFSLEISPQAPVVVDNKVRFNRANMELNKAYKFSYKEKEFLAIRTSETSIEIFRIKK